MSALLAVQVFLLLAALANTACFKSIHSADPLNAILIFSVVSLFTTLFSGYHIITNGGFRYTFSKISKKHLAAILFTDLFTDLLNILPLTMPHMSFLLHTILQRLQSGFAIFSNHLYGRLIRREEIAAALISAAGVIVFAMETIYEKSEDQRTWYMFLGILSVIFSKSALEISQQLEMTAVKSGVPKMGVLFLTSVLGFPVSLIIRYFLPTTKNIDPSTSLLLCLAGCIQCFYLYLKMVAHSYEVSSVTHSFLSNLRYSLTICIGRPDISTWSAGLWSCALSVILSTTFQLKSIQSTIKKPPIDKGIYPTHQS